MEKLFKKVEFWILIFFVIRLIGITAPPLETGHNWRQVTGLMVARNYLEIDHNILFPRIDNHQGKSGIIGMEFPTLNYTHFIVSKIFGYTHWYGRLINLLISSIGLVFFNKIIQRFFSQRVALVSTIFLLCSIWFSFSRKMMPDTYCISLMFVGIYYGIRYLDRGKVFNIVMYLLFTSLAILSKIPAGIYFALSIPVIFSNLNRKRVIIISALTLIPLTFCYIWYFIWNPYLSITYNSWYNDGKSISEGFSEIINNLYLVFRNFYFHSFYSYIIFAFFLFGLLKLILSRNRFFFLAIFVITIAFLIYIFKSGLFFYHHNYYIIPFVPVMSLIAGYYISFFKKKWLFVSLIVVGVSESILNQQHDFFIKKSERYKLELESIADLVSSKNELIAINGNNNPQQIYLTHRKGWTCNDSDIADESFIKEIYKKGCRYIFINKNSSVRLVNRKVVFNNENFIVYDLKTR